MSTTTPREGLDTLCPSSSATEQPAPADARHQDPVIERARQAGRAAGLELARTPLSARQRATIEQVFGGRR